MTEDRGRGPLDFDDDGEPAVPSRRSPPVGAPADHAGADRVPRPRAPGPGVRYLWVVGAGAVVLVALLLIATVHHGTERGARGVPNGEVMPSFAVPAALGALE